jgi:hypothetical protein
MTDEERTLVGYRLERAEEAIQEAGMLLNGGHVNTCVNRLYYACFYAVSAALLCKGLSTSRHSHLRSLLHRDFVKTGLVDEKMGNHFDTLFDSRQEGDYADLAEFDIEDVRAWFEPTRQFVDHFKNLVASQS